jgi:voltage-gated potassium channel
VGIVFSIVIAAIGQYDPAAFTFHDESASSSEIASSFGRNLYYTFITMTTVGYGDLLPVKPYARSLATLIAITGQFYLGIIVAMLVGKYASQRNDN